MNAEASLKEERRHRLKILWMYEKSGRNRLKSRGKGSLGKELSVTERAFKAVLGTGRMRNACSGWCNMNRGDRKARPHKPSLLPIFIRE